MNSLGHRLFGLEEECLNLELDEDINLIILDQS
jgi:hypothetical protein